MICVLPAPPALPFAQDVLAIAFAFGRPFPLAKWPEDTAEMTPESGQRTEEFRRVQ